MTDTKSPQPDETILGGESSIPDTAGAAAGGADEDNNAPPAKDDSELSER